MFTPLNLPKIPLQLTKNGNNVYVFCEFRKKKLLLTPEEWVRQHILHFLVQKKGVPFSLIASEFSITVNDLQRRCDGVLFGRDGKPVAIIECKQPKIQLGQEVMYQVAQYNFKLQVQWLILTNGLQTFTAKVNQSTGEIEYLENIPNYTTMLSP